MNIKLILKKRYSKKYGRSYVNSYIQGSLGTYALNFRDYQIADVLGVSLAELYNLVEDDVEPP